MSVSTTGQAIPLTYSEDELNRVIPLLMNEIGVPSHLKGHRYLSLAVNIVYSDHTMIRSVTSGLYSIIAEQYNTTASCVERDMRTALKAAVNSGRLIRFDSYFAEVLTVSNSISARNFIAIISEKLRHNLIIIPKISSGKPA